MGQSIRKILADNFEVILEQRQMPVSRFRHCQPATNFGCMRLGRGFISQLLRLVGLWVFDKGGFFGVVQ